ncbi:hypothetical protein IAU60_000444 [Kwoniella sp. DSM 27419]
MGVRTSLDCMIADTDNKTPLDVPVDTRKTPETLDNSSFRYSTQCETRSLHVDTSFSADDAETPLRSLVTSDPPSSVISSTSARSVNPVTSRPNPSKRKVSFSPHGEPEDRPHVKRERSCSSYGSDDRLDMAVPLLPVPLPSKRAKKRPSSQALLIPVHQIPVFPLPPLPIINDPELIRQVFTHESLFDKAKGRFEDPEDDPAGHYEKLEHVGDSILGMIVTTWLHETRPNLTIGTATKLKAHLVSNATLSHISELYNFPQRLRGDTNILPTLRAETDIRAAMVEAYIAAVYFSYPTAERLGHGIQVIDEWLREMYEPLYDFFYTYTKDEYEQHQNTVGTTLEGRVVTQTPAEIARIDTAAMGMEKLVQMYTEVQERELRWEEERNETAVGALWRVRCTVDGIDLGEAVRPYKKSARNMAGWEAAKKEGIVSA